MTRTILKVLMVALVSLVMGVDNYSALETGDRDHSRMVQFMIRQKQQQHHRHLKHSYSHQRHRQLQFYHNEQNESIDRLLPRQESPSTDPKQYDLRGSQKFPKKNSNSILNKYKDYEDFNAHSSNHLQNGETPIEREDNALRNVLHCPKCVHPAQDLDPPQFDKDELTQLRIELVKQQILEKLRLKERPQVAAVTLPKPISEGTTIEQESTDDQKIKELDDYYARTSKKYIFLEIGKNSYFL